MEKIWPYDDGRKEEEEDDEEKKTLRSGLDLKMSFCKPQLSKQKPNY